MCLCALVVFSCETEDADILEQEFITANLTASTSNPPLGWDDWNTREFSRWLTIISEHVANAVHMSEAAREEFQDIVDTHDSSQILGSSVVIPLRAIITNTQSALYQAIKESITCLGHPDGGWGSPYPPLGNGMLTFSEGDFLNNVLNEHCLELYLPFGFSSFGSNETFKVIGMGHPIKFTTSNSRYNARQFETEIGCNIIQVNTSETYNNLLILRPNRIFSISQDNYCDYEIYSHIDFTEFFEQ